MIEKIKLLQAEILRTRLNSENVEVDVSELNNDIVLINRDIDTINANMQTATSNIEVLQLSDISTKNDINNLQLQNSEQDDLIETNKVAIGASSVKIANNTQRIDTLEIKEDNRAHYLGAFKTTASLIAFPTPSPNDFADNYETATRWIYTNSAWTNTTEAIPTDSTILGNTSPLMDGVVNAGVATLASRVDHVHPTNTSLVPASRTINNKPLSADILMGAGDVGAVPITRTINYHPLSSDVTLYQADLFGQKRLLQIQLTPLYPGNLFPSGAVNFSILTTMIPLFSIQDIHAMLIHERAIGQENMIPANGTIRIDDWDRCIIGITAATTPFNCICLYYLSTSNVQSLIMPRNFPLQEISVGAFSLLNLGVNI